MNRCIGAEISIMFGSDVVEIVITMHGFNLPLSINILNSIVRP